MASPWSPGAIFSPSQARQQLAQAKDWSYIDTWLIAKYNRKPPPQFERNNDTLKALLALASWNEGVDEEKALLAKVEAKALEELAAEAASDPDADILEGLSQSLTREGKQSLESIAALSASLGNESVEPEKLGRSIINLTKMAFDLDQQGQRINALQDKLEYDLKLLRETHLKIQSEDFTASPYPPQKTAEWNRATKILTAKVQEYKDRLSSLNSSIPPCPLIPEIIVEEKEIIKLKAWVVDLNEQAKAFQGLPHDKNLSRLEVERVRRELEILTRKRDGLFEGLVDGGGAY